MPYHAPLGQNAKNVVGPFCFVGQSNVVGQKLLRLIPHNKHVMQAYLQHSDIVRGPITQKHTHNIQIGHVPFVGV